MRCQKKIFLIIWLVFHFILNIWIMSIINILIRYRILIPVSYTHLLAMYASSKGALEAFSKNTAREWGALGIRSNVVVPGFMDTAMSSTPVSYTHLDVYKRQVLDIPICHLIQRKGRNMQVISSFQWREPRQEIAHFVKAMVWRRRPVSYTHLSPVITLKSPTKKARPSLGQSTNLVRQ